MEGCLFVRFEGFYSSLISPHNFPLWLSLLLYDTVYTNDEKKRLSLSGFLGRLNTDGKYLINANCNL